MSWKKQRPNCGFELNFYTFMLHILRDTTHSTILYIITCILIYYSICLLNFILPACRTNFARNFTASHKRYRKPGIMVIICTTKNFFFTLRLQRAFICVPLLISDHSVINNFNTTLAQMIRRPVAKLKLQFKITTNIICVLKNEIGKIYWKFECIMNVSALLNVSKCMGLRYLPLSIFTVLRLRINKQCLAYQWFYGNHNFRNHVLQNLLIQFHNPDKCIYCAVRTGCLYIVQVYLSSSKIFVLFNSYVLFVLYCSVCCLYVNVYCTTATGCQPNCS
jgi:hypothetical protein